MPELACNACNHKGYLSQLISFIPTTFFFFSYIFSSTYYFQLYALNLFDDGTFEK